MIPHSGESELITDVSVLFLFPSVKEPKPGVAVAGAFRCSLLLLHLCPPPPPPTRPPRLVYIIIKEARPSDRFGLSCCLSPEGSENPHLSVSLPVSCCQITPGAEAPGPGTQTLHLTSWVYRHNLCVFFKSLDFYTTFYFFLFNLSPVSNPTFPPVFPPGEA